MYLCSKAVKRLGISRCRSRFNSNVASTSQPRKGDPFAVIAPQLSEIRTSLLSLLGSGHPALAGSTVLPSGRYQPLPYNVVSPQRTLGKMQREHNCTHNGSPAQRASSEGDLKGRPGSTVSLRTCPSGRRYQPTLCNHGIPIIRMQTKTKPLCPSASYFLNSTIILSTIPGDATGRSACASMMIRQSAGDQFPPTEGKVHSSEGKPVINSFNRTSPQQNITAV